MSADQVIASRLQMPVFFGVLDRLIERNAEVAMRHEEKAEMARDRACASSRPQQTPR
jgi:hypothetical protein